MSDRAVTNLQTPKGLRLVYVDELPLPDYRRATVAPEDVDNRVGGFQGLAPREA